MQKLTVTIPVGAQSMALSTARPDGPGPFPAIVVIQHAPGLDTFMQTMVERLAQAGYVAAAPDLYHRLDARLDGMAKMKLLRDREVEADVAATVDWLRGAYLIHASYPQAAFRDLRVGMWYAFTH